MTRPEATWDGYLRLIGAAPELLRQLRYVTNAIQAFDGKWEPTASELNALYAAVAAAEKGGKQ